MKRNDMFLALTCILIGFFYRLIPGYPSNFTPVAAMALMGGMYISRKSLAFLAPIVALYLGDLILNNTINRPFFPEHSGLVLWSNYMYFNLLAMGGIVFLGIGLSKSKIVSKIISGSLFSSLAFFLITNLGVWLTSAMYPKSLAGLGACFTAAVPFFQNSLVSNVLFVTLFIGSIEFAKKYMVKGDLAGI